MNFTVSQEALSALAASLLKHENSKQYDCKQIFLKSSHEMLITSSEAKQYEYNQNSFKGMCPEKENYLSEVEQYESSEYLLKEISPKVETSSSKSSTINKDESNETEIYLKALLLKRSDEADVEKKKVSPIDANNAISDTCINIKRDSPVEIDIKEEDCLLQKTTAVASLKPKSQEYFSKHSMFSPSFENIISTNTSNQLEMKEGRIEENKVQQTLLNSYERFKPSTEFTNLAKDHQEANLRLYIQRIIDTSRQLVLNKNNTDYFHSMSDRSTGQGFIRISRNKNNCKPECGKLNHSQTKTNQEVKKLIKNQLTNNKNISLFSDNFSNARSDGKKSATKRSSQNQKCKKKGYNIKSLFTSLFRKRRHNEDE